MSSVHREGRAHTHSLTLSLSHTPTHSHSLTHKLTHQLTHTHTHILSHVHTHTRAHTHTLTHSLSHTHTHTHTLTHSHILTLSHTHTQSLTCPHTHTHTHTHAYSLSLSLSHTHTHTHSRTNTHSHTHTIDNLLQQLRNTRGLKHVIVFHGTTATSKPRPPHSWDFTITLRHTTLGRTPLDKWSACRRYIWQNTTLTHRHKSTPAGRMRNRNPSKRAVADPHLRPRDDRDVLEHLIQSRQIGISPAELAVRSSCNLHVWGHTLHSQEDGMGP
jgi:hypothetical protein